MIDPRQIQISRSSINPNVMAVNSPMSTLADLFSTKKDIGYADALKAKPTEPTPIDPQAKQPVYAREPYRTPTPNITPSTPIPKESTFLSTLDADRGIYKWDRQQAYKNAYDHTLSLDDISINNIMYSENYAPKAYKDKGNGAWDVGFGYQNPKEVNQYTTMDVYTAKKKAWDFIQNLRKVNAYAYDAFANNPEARIILDDLGYNLKYGLDYDSIKEAIASGDINKLMEVSLLFTGAKGKKDPALIRRRHMTRDVTMNWRKHNGY